MAQIMAQYGARPPGEWLDGRGGTQPRFFNGSNTAWDPQDFDGLGPTNEARPETLTYSFPADGTPWLVGPTSQPNILAATLLARFGSTDLDEGRELIRQALAQWRVWTGVNFIEVADNNSALDNSPVRVAQRGDIRIGSIPLGTNGTLAYNYYPNGGGDMTINSSYFIGNAIDGYSNLASSSSTFRYLRNVVTHEFGHGLCLFHPTPCSNSKIMEPFINTGFDGLQIDDIRGGQRNYGDRFAGNISAATAQNFGDLTTPIQTSVIARNLSTNGSAGANGTNADWFRFTLSTAQNVTITVTPLGGTYYNAPQTSGCNPTTTSSPAAPLINAGGAGDLNLELRNATGTTVISGMNTGGPGVAETINVVGLAAGTYTIQVVDWGVNAPENQYVQLYDLAIRVGASKAPPVAGAGINKRVTADTNCFFFGSIGSYTTDTDPTGNPNSITAYAWDRDGDGTFEAAGSQPNTPPMQYPSNGVYTVTLRVTDENARVATDQITVTVTGATTSISAVSPASVLPGAASFPITITGKNFKGVTTLGQIQFAGGGITLGGAPTVNALGTQITGVTMTIAAGATLGDRNLTITNSDGLGSGGTKTAAFTVGPLTGACCTPDGSCTISGQTTCVSGAGVYQGNSVVCTTGLCPVLTGACCATDGSCQPTIAGECSSSFQGVGTSCSPANPCPQPTGACCASDGSCALQTAAECAASFLGTGTACSPNPCPQPTGACCAGDGSCALQTAAECAANFLGVGTACSPNPCPQPTGACCAGVGCSSTTQAACAGPNVQWRGANTVCNAPGNSITPCCKADFSQNGQVTVDDLFLYINAWFTSSPTADISGNGADSPTIDDLFLYFNAYFVGC